MSNPTASNRRKSVFTPSINNSNFNEASSQTIELERLEQEITLTLQTIDKSLSKSHHIINDKLIPIVKRYHGNSKKIWTGVNFWKTFLEASANVELRGYEEAVQYQNDLSADDGQALKSDQILDDEGVDLRSDIADKEMRENEELSPIKMPTGGGILMGSTDSGIFTKGKELKENPIMPQVNQNNIGFDTSDSILPPLPPISLNVTNTNETDVDQTTPTLQRTESRHFVIHNNLDSTYKVEVSPRKANKRTSAVSSLTPRKPSNKKRKSFYQQKFDSSPFEIEPPQLRSDVQFSPVRRTSPLRKVQNDSEGRNFDENETQRFPLTPRYGAGGNLLRTPGQVAQVAKRYSGRQFQPDVSKNNINNNNNNIYDNEFEDSEENPKLSPPVTVNFATAHTTQKLSATPAREAAQNIVKDILNNVSGIDDTSMDKSSSDNSLFTEKVHDKKEQKKTVLDDDFDAFLDRPEKGLKEQDDWSE